MGKFHENENWLWLILLVFIAMVLIIVRVERHDTKQIEKDGVETLGTIIDKSYFYNRKSKQLNYNIRFEFEHNGYKIIVNSGIMTTERDYMYAVVGRKYIVKYLPKHPRTARIYIHSPNMEILVD